MTMLASISSFDKGRLRPSITRITTRSGQIFEEVRREGDTVFERVFVGQGPTPQYLEDSLQGFSELDCHAFEEIDEKWKPLSGFSPASTVHCESDVLKVVSYNVWFSEKNWKNRALALLDIVEEQNADIICFQEVTKDFLDEVLKSKWIRASYVVTDSRGTTVLPYGVIMLIRSTLAITRARIHSLPTNMGRRFVLCEMIWRGAPLAVGTVHLESMDNASVREAQLKRIFDISTAIPRLIIVGDFNFHAGMPENRLLSSAVVDSWTAAGAVPCGRRGALIDRVVHRAPDFAPACGRLIGTAPVVPPAGGTRATEPASGGRPAGPWPDDLYPSDHDGVVVEFRCRPAPAAGAAAYDAPAPA